MKGFKFEFMSRANRRGFFVVNALDIIYANIYAINYCTENDYNFDDLKPALLLKSEGVVCDNSKSRLGD